MKNLSTSCAVRRRILVESYFVNPVAGTRTASVIKWRTRKCGTPLFTDAERKSGKCRACAKGWKTPDNYPAGTERPTREVNP